MPLASGREKQSDRTDNLTGSREQNYRPEDCGVCHAGLVGKKGHGFWEGGKGTRDKSRMSKKDPRKFKRMPGGAAKKKT
jgi:hypothetical protein